MFCSPVFSISAAQFATATMVLFTAMLHVPSYLQTVRHTSAFTAGLYVIPLLGGLIAATIIAGPVIARTGRYKIYSVIGAIMAGASAGGLALAAAGGSTPVIVVPMIFAGAGSGCSSRSRCGRAERGRVPPPGHRHRRAQLLQVDRRRRRRRAVRRHPRPRPDRRAHRRRLPGPSSPGTIPFTVLAHMLAVIMRGKPLSEEMADIAAGKAEAPEY